MGKIIIIYNIKSEKLKKLEEICKSLNIRIKKVADTMLGQPVGFLAGVAGMKKTGSVYKGSGIADEMLIFADFDDGELDEFLKAYKDSGMEPVSLKAVITPDNVSWTFVELYNELVRERQAYESAKKAVENADI